MAKLRGGTKSSISPQILSRRQAIMRTESGRRPIIKLTDAQRMARKFPKTFEVPDTKTLAKLKKGDEVKLIFSDIKERMFVIITKRDGNNFEGKLDNIPFTTGPRVVRLGDKITFKTKNIASTE